MLLRICACLALAATACVDETSADSQASTVGSGSGNHQGPCRPPPQEALDACAGAVADADCAFDVDGHHVEGTCRTGPDGNGPLACAPDHPPPPPEAIDACDGADADADCSFDVDGHHVEGTCRAAPDGNGPLACAPDQPPPPPN
jgi:hypothetical protein